MNIYEAYQELKKGKFVRIEGCSQVFFKLSLPFLSEEGRVIIMSAHVESMNICNAFAGPDKLSFLYPKLVTEIEDLLHFEREFESFTEDELLKRLQDDWEERKKALQKRADVAISQPN